MRELLIRAGAAVLNGIYRIFKLLPVKKKITYISRQSNKLSVDFRLVMCEMAKRCPDYSQIALIKMIGNGLPEKIRYCFHMLRQMYHIATSEMVVLDTYCIAVSLLKQRRSLIVIQMWHALGAMKKFGYSIVDKSEGTELSLAETMRMHKNYTYVFSSSEFCSRYFAEAFRVSMDKMKVMPLPRLDLLLNREYVESIKKKIKEKYPVLSNSSKKLLVYAPTFRKEKGEFDEDALATATEKLAQLVDYAKYELIVKFHPLSDIKIKNKKVIQDTTFSTIDFCQLADAVILDYSAVVFEVAMLGKPMYFYAFDYESYMRTRDIYIDFEKYVPGIITDNPLEIIRAIERCDSDDEKTEKFRNLMISGTKSGSYTGDIADFFEKVLQEQRDRKERRNG